MMSRDFNLRSMMRTNEDIETVFMKKLAEKKKILEEAQDLYHEVSANVEKTRIELTEIKMERFKMEGMLQESEIRVQVYEKRERELRDEAEKARTAIKEAEIRQNEERAARDGHNKTFIRRVTEMAEEYCRFKRNCDRKNVSESFQDLRAADAQLTGEIEEIMAEMGIKESENFVSLVSADPADELALDNLRDLQRHLEYDIQCAESTNANIQAQTDQLEALKNALQKEIEALGEIMQK